jgi:hypothetical protein
MGGFLEGSCLAFRDFSSLTTYFQPSICMRLLYVSMAHVKTKFDAEIFRV